MKKRIYFILLSLLVLVFILSICLGSVNIPAKDLITSFTSIFTGKELDAPNQNIIYHIRLPRVIGSALVGASLSLAGAIMQGVLKNPLADGSTLGVSSAASLGAAIAIVTGFSLPGLPYSGIVILAVIFALLSLIIIMFFSLKIDKTVSNATIILLGIILSMLTSSVMSILIVMFKEDIQNLVFWTMGSLAGTSYEECIILFISLLVFSLIAMALSTELNAFALGENQARNIGVNVGRMKKTLLFSSSALVGIAVAIAGSISFVGIIIPHIVRLLVGPNHEKLLPLTIIVGAIFLMLADLISRTIFSPVELPIGAITSVIGTLVFISIFMRERR